MGIICHVGRDANKEHFLLLDQWPEKYGVKYFVPLGYFKERIYDAEIKEGLDVDFLYPKSRMNTMCPLMAGKSGLGQ